MPHCGEQGLLFGNIKELYFLCSASSAPGTPERKLEGPGPKELPLVIGLIMTNVSIKFS